MSQTALERACFSRLFSQISLKLPHGYVFLIYSSGLAKAWQKDRFRWWNDNKWVAKKHREDPDSTDIETAIAV